MSKENGKEQLTKKMDFSGAGLKDEKKKIKIERELDEEEEEEEIEERKTEKINLNDIKEDKTDDDFEINFNDEKSVNDYTSKKTKKSENKTEEEETIDSIKTEIEEAQKKADDLTPEDFYDIAEFIMSLIDATAASALKWWAKDSSDSAYSLPKTKKDKLTKQLAKILIKYNAKFSIEFMFLIGLCIMYIPAFRLARKTRKENSIQKQIQVIQNPIVQKTYTESKREEKINNAPVVEPVFENKEMEIIKTDSNIEENNNEQIVEIAKPKRKNHRPRKA